MLRYYYFNSIKDFLSESNDEILGKLANNNDFSLELTQRTAWISEINILKGILGNYEGSIFLNILYPVWAVVLMWF